MSPPRQTAPNPVLLLSLPVLAFASYAYLVNKRAQENPASRQPRQAANPLTPPHLSRRRVQEADNARKVAFFSIQLIFIMGLIEKAKEALHMNKGNKANEPLSQTASPVPAFDSEKVMIIYVLGGPGAGKGTQCARIVEDFGFVHLSAGDLLREEQKREGSTYGALISEHIRNGTIVPMEVTVKLLENAIRAQLEQPHPGAAWVNGHGRFLIDGFPRKMDQAIKFDETVCMSSFVLFFDTTEEVMLQRLLERGKTSGREDDNEESIKKRFRTFVETSMPVVDKYRLEGKVVSIDSTRPVEVVRADVQKVLRDEFTKRGLPEK